MIDPSELARLFHETYERLAPMFNYTTREDTREFDSLSTHGRLMIAVMEDAIIPYVAALLRTTAANARRETWEKAAKIAETYEHLAAARLHAVEKLCVNEYRGEFLDGQIDQAEEIKTHLCAEAEKEREP